MQSFDFSLLGLHGVPRPYNVFVPDIAERYHSCEPKDYSDSFDTHSQTARTISRVSWAVKYLLIYSI